MESIQSTHNVVLAVEGAIKAKALTKWRHYVDQCSRQRGTIWRLKHCSSVCYTDYTQLNIMEKCDMKQIYLRYILMDGNLKMIYMQWLFGSNPSLGSWLGEQKKYFITLIVSVGSFSWLVNLGQLFDLEKVFKMIPDPYYYLEPKSGWFGSADLIC